MRYQVFPFSLRKIALFMSKNLGRKVHSLGIGPDGLALAFHRSGKVQNVLRGGGLGRMRALAYSNQLVNNPQRIQLT